MSKKENNFRTNVKISPAGIISLLILYLLNGEKTFAIIIVSALIHELGHLSAMKLLGCKVSEFTVGFLNLNIKYNKYKTSYKADVLISVSGPLLNFAVGLLAYCFGLTGLFYANISLACLNLLPFESLDGGNILRSVMQIRRGKNDDFFDSEMKLYGKIFATSFVLFLSFVSDFNLSVVFMGVSSLMCKNISTP